MTEQRGNRRPPTRTDEGAGPGLQPGRNQPGRNQPGRIQSASQPGRGQGRPDRTAACVAAAAELLADAGRGLGRAMRASDLGERYAAAHLAALRGAAAVVASRARPGKGRAGNVWDLLDRVAPEFGEWTAFFRAGVPKRQLAEAGIIRTIGQRETDDLIRQTAQFLELAEAAIRALTNSRAPRSGTTAMAAGAAR